MVAWVNLDTIQRPSGGATLLTAWGTQVNDNLNFLSGTKSALVATSQTTTSATYADLATVGPTVTVTTGANALVIITMQINGIGSPNTAFAGFAVSGATTLAAADTAALICLEGTGTGQTVAGIFPAALTAGSNTFTVKYRVSGGTGTFGNRYLSVIPLP